MEHSTSRGGAGGGNPPTPVRLRTMREVADHILHVSEDTVYEPVDDEDLRSRKTTGRCRTSDPATAEFIREDGEGATETTDTVRETGPDIILELCIGRLTPDGFVSEVRAFEILMITGFSARLSEAERDALSCMNYHRTSVGLGEERFMAVAVGVLPRDPAGEVPDAPS